MPSPMLILPWSRAISRTHAPADWRLALRPPPCRLYAALSSTHGTVRFFTRAPLRQTVLERRIIMAIRPRTYPTSLLYVRFHLSERRLVMRFSNARASLHAIPSTEYTSGVLLRRRSRQAWRYLSFFRFTCPSSTFFDVVSE